MTQISTGISDFMAPGLFKIFADEFKRKEMEYKKIFSVSKSRRQYETTTTVEGLAIAQQKVEGTPVSYEDLTQGYNKDHTHITWALGYRISREAYDDDLYKAIGAKASTYLGYSMKMRYETVGADILNNSFTNTFTGPDGKELCATDHPWASGGTYANEETTPSALSASALRSVITNIRKIQDASGDRLQLIPKILVVPSDLQFTAQTILKSAQEPGNANNDYNPLKDVGLKLVVNDWLGSATRWWVLCENNDLLYFERQKPAFENGDDFDTGDAKFKVTARILGAWGTPLGTWGNNAS